MLNDLLQTKLHVPPLRPSLVPRRRLLEKLNFGLAGKLTLISAPAGFGKTTLVCDWLTGGQRPLAWLSLDEQDTDPIRFLTYFIAAVQKIAPDIGQRALTAIQSNPVPSSESLLATLINDLATVSDRFVLVLDDYHVVDSPVVDEMLTFLLTHLPPQLHLVITTREDPNLPLAKMRMRGQLTELRANDLRFTLDEATVFFQQVMGLTLTEAEIAALESRTEGWVAGLQLAALSLQGHQGSIDDFINAFSGSHRFVLDYLLEEVLHQQPDNVQRFLLQTAILDRLCGSLCEAVVNDSAMVGQEMLESLDRANLFLMPLDNERQWYRYHHLFADLLQQRLHQIDSDTIKQLHKRASVWYEAHHHALEAFQHAVAAHDIARATHLAAGDGLPLYYQGAIMPVLKWLETLPAMVRDANPSLWVMYASVLTLIGQPPQRVEEILQSAESALSQTASDEDTKDLLGQIAALRAMLAIPQNQLDMMVAQSQLALALLHPDNAPVRTTTTWTLGYAYQVQGDRPAASQAYREAIVQSKASGNMMITVGATTCLGQIQESDTQLHQAEATYHRVRQLVGDPPWPTACEAYLGLARIQYQWNDLATSQQYAQQSLALARQLDNVDTPIGCYLLLARVQLAQGDVVGATAMVTEAEQFIQQNRFDQWQEETMAVRILILLHQGDFTTAVQLAKTPISQARVYLAQEEPAKALAVLAPAYQQAVDKNWADQQLAIMALQALAHRAQGERGQAHKVLTKALTRAMPGGFIRLFVDEGQPMLALLTEARQQGVLSTYIQQLFAAFDAVGVATAVATQSPAQPLSDPLTDRELDVLRLLDTRLSGPDIARELMVSLNTMRTHTKNIYSKLNVNNRRTAVDRAKELKLL